MVAEDVQANSRLRGCRLDYGRIGKRRVPKCRNMRNDIENVIDQPILRPPRKQRERPTRRRRSGATQRGTPSPRSQSLGEIVSKVRRQGAPETMPHHHDRAHADRVSDAFRRILMRCSPCLRIGQAHRLINVPKPLLDLDRWVARMRNEEELGVNDPLDDAVSAANDRDMRARISIASGEKAKEHAARGLMLNRFCAAPLGGKRAS